MKYIVFIIILFSCLHAALANDMYKHKQNNTTVYTNINRTYFFARAFNKRNLRRYGKKKIINTIKKTAYKFNVNPDIAVSIAKIESDFNHNSVSSSGAVGVMQLMKQTASYYGVSNINNLNENIEGGIRFLKHLIEKYHDEKLVAAAYNAGETAVDRYGGIPPYKETQRYVKKFLNIYNKKMNIKKLKQIVYKPIKKVNNGTYSNIGGRLW